MSESPTAAAAVIYKIFQRPPGVEQSHSAVIDDISVLIPRVLLVSRLKRVGSVNQVEVEILKPEPVEARGEGRFDAFGAVVGVPHLCRNENVFARDSVRGESSL